jgi:hypothetical protein
MLPKMLRHNEEDGGLTNERPFHTEAPQGAILTVQGGEKRPHKSPHGGVNCSVCHVRQGPYTVRYPHLTVRYCGIDLPMGLAENIKKYKGSREDVIAKIQRDGGRLINSPRNKWNSDDRRDMRANWMNYTEEQLKEADAWNLPVRGARLPSEYQGLTVGQAWNKDQEEEPEDEEDDDEEDDEEDSDTEEEVDEDEEEDENEE